MNFQKYYFKEVKSTPRKGIQHIWGENGKYAMSPNDFIELIDYIKQNKGVLNSAIANLSEKADGFSLRFGQDARNKFYIESSHSGPIFDEGKFREFTLDKKGKSDPISEGFEDILKTLKHDKKLQDYLKSINTENGIKIVAEAFYMPLGEYSDMNDDVVKFIATWYSKEKLGEWATFVVINATDGQGEPLDEEMVLQIKKDLKGLSTKAIKFEDSDIPNYQDIDLNSEIEKVDKLINTLQTEYGKKIDEILQNPSRSRDVINQRNRIKKEMLSLQKEFANRLSGLMNKGKFGKEYEGLVFTLADGVMFKIVSDRFKEAKKIYNTERKQ